MARQRNPDREKAKQMWLDAKPGTIKLKDIAAALGYPENTIRKWKSEDKWESERSGKKKRNAPNKKDVPKKRRGAPYGNQNAKGNSGGGAPIGNQNALKHGGYSQIFWDTLSEEEKEMIDTMDHDVEQQLIDEISLLTVREHRILHQLKKYREIANGKAGQVVSSVVRSEDKREFANEEERLLYEERNQQKIDAGEKLPGRSYHVTTTTEAAIDIVHRLEEALSRCQDQKRRALDSLDRVRSRDNGSGDKPVENNLMEALLGYAKEDIDLSDIHELQQTSDSDDDLVV